MGPSLKQLAQSLAAGDTTSRALVEDCLAAIDAKDGEGSRVFTHVDCENALVAADGIDRLRKAGAAPSPYAGIPVSIKDLFDMAGQQTCAGSRVLNDAPLANADAAAVTRWKAAGLIAIGRTNMTEFAFSGVGINPHYGTPKCTYDRATGRVPGGSSSGAAIALTDGMAHGSLGTDTGGSCRIPAAFNGLVGFKPSAQRVPTQGAFPLSTTLDSVGPLGRSVECCAILDSLLAGNEISALQARDMRGLRIAVPDAYVLRDMDDTVAKAFEATLAKLAAAGAIITTCAFPEIDEIPAANAKGGFAAPESLASHRKLIERKAHLYDKRVLSRIERGHEQSASDYVDLVRTRARLIAAFNARMKAFDVLAYPAVPIIPPAIAAFDRDEDFTRLNLLILRNPAVINFMDGCAISVPMTRPPEAAPTGLMLSCVNGDDRKLFAIAAGVEALLG